MFPLAWLGFSAHDPGTIKNAARYARLGYRRDDETASGKSASDKSI
jgi:hypothetical protein